MDENIVKAKRDHYYKMLKEMIAKNKIYPKVAVRRGIQGDVKINFTISKNGELVKFDIIDGNQVFKKSIKSAMDKTFPVKPPQGILLSKTDLTVTLAYRLY